MLSVVDKNENGMTLMLINFNLKFNFYNPYV